MKEFNIPYQYWLKLPLKGDRKSIGYSDLIEAIQWRYKLEREELERAKGTKKGMDLEFG